MSEGAEARKRILVVDDDPQIQLLLTEALGDHYDVAVAQDGVEALQALERERPDLVLCDVFMPEMDGLECLRRLTDQFPNLRVIMMTGQTSWETVMVSLRRRAFDFLAKPFTMGQLRALVKEALEPGDTEEFRVLSATTKWVEVEAPCSLGSARRLQRFLSHLRTGLAPEVQLEVATAFRELLQNAIEHGGKNDPTQYVRICYLRLEKIIVYSIRDPGEGFRLEEVEHAMVANPPDNPFRHVAVREKMKLRPGGFGLFLTRQLVDELIYNQKHNEVVFVKYLRSQDAKGAT